MLTSKIGGDLLASAPRDRILTETDAPFLQASGKPLNAGDVTGALTGIASIWGLGDAETRGIISANADRALS